MKIISGITSQPKQQMTLVLDDGASVFLYLEYCEQQSGWFVNIASGNWSVDGLRVTASPNMLWKWQNIASFGLAVLTQNNVEPLNLMDFVDGTVTTYLLDSVDVSTVQANVFSGN